MDSKQYHTFLSHNNNDKPAVEYLAQRLRQEGLEPWLDKWNLIPGEHWQSAIEEALDICQTCTVFIGPSGIGPWQNEEMRFAIDRRITQTKGRFRVIPVVLPGGHREQRSRLPAFLVATTWVEFHKTLDDGQSFHRLVCGIRGMEPGAGQLIVEGCPYRGLQAFHTEHTLFFFGREALTEWLIDKLRSVPECSPGSSRENRFLAIIGASGSGKSSLARAGLIPALKRGEFEGRQKWPIVICRPGQEPVESLTIALAAEPALKEHVLSVRSFMSDLRDDERTLHLMLRTALHNAPETRRVVILIDQFEEIFTLCHDDLLRRALIDNLLYAASVTAGKTIVILTMRADFYGRCAVFTNLAAALSDHQLLVGPMTEEELRRAIERPAQLVGCELEAGLTEMLIHDFKNQAGALPLLQHALSELWKRRDCRRLTLAAYEDIGRLHGALERRANELFDSFNETQQEMCKRVFMRLIQPGEGTDDTKRRAMFQELLPTEGDTQSIDQVIQTLADARLISTGGGKNRPEERSVEIAHEALIRGWSKLRLWIDSDRQALRIQRRLSDASAEWDHSGRNDSYLYVGVRLAEVEEWSLTHTDVLNPLEQEFLRASIGLRNKKRDAELRQKQFRRRAVLAMGEGVAATLLAIFAFLCFFRAQQAQREAEKAHQEVNVLSLAFASQSQLGVNNDRALLLAVEAGKSVEAMKNNQFVADEVDKSLRSVLLWQGDTLHILSAHTKRVLCATWNSKGTSILTASGDGTARVWDAENGKELICLKGHTGSVNNAAWNKAGTRIVTAGNDGTARVWDAETGRELACLAGHTGNVNKAAWNRAGTRIVTASCDGTARVWNAENGEELACLTGHTDWVNKAAWNRAGTRIVTTSTARRKSLAS
jgi:energy-coupling factor transporter ATP-binding protein EcfA2